MSKPSHHNLALRLGSAAVVMFGFGFALVPLYDIFCEVVGIRVSIDATAAESITEVRNTNRTVKLELLANTSQGTPWAFEPSADTINVATGQLLETTYLARNLSVNELTAVATPDVRPAEAGKYFKKIECFCFEEQNFSAGEERELLIRFFVDPELPAHIDRITLAYTLFEKPNLAAVSN